MHRLNRLPPIAVLAGLFLSATAVPAPATPQDPDGEQLKHEAFEQVASMAKL